MSKTLDEDENSHYVRVGQKLVRIAKTKAEDSSKPKETDHYVLVGKETDEVRRQKAWDLLLDTAEKAKQYQQGSPYGVGTEFAPHFAAIAGKMTPDQATALARYRAKKLGLADLDPAEERDYNVDDPKHMAGMVDAFEKSDDQQGHAIWQQWKKEKLQAHERYFDSMLKPGDLEARRTAQLAAEQKRAEEGIAEGERQQVAAADPNTFVGPPAPAPASMPTSQPAVAGNAMDFTGEEAVR